MSEIVLFGTETSGHTQRVAAFLSILGVPWRLERTPAEMRRTPEFLAKNPFGQVPVLDDGELRLTDSNAMLVYLARRYDASDRWLPRDPIGEARVQKWLSVAAGEIAFGPARARAAKNWPSMDYDWDSAATLARRVLALLEAHLADRTHLAADHPTIADLAIYGYTKRAPEGDVPIDPYPSILAWHARIEAIPGFVPLPPVR
jgi:glutathione S-transferase